MVFILNLVKLSFGLILDLDLASTPIIICFDIATPGLGLILDMIIDFQE